MTIKRKVLSIKMIGNDLVKIVDVILLEHSLESEILILSCKMPPQVLITPLSHDRETSP